MEKIKQSLILPKEIMDIQMPNDMVPEYKKDHDWFLKFNRYYSTFYNPESNNFDWASPVTDKTNSGPDSNNFMPRVCDNMVNNFSYLVGEQPNINYRYLEQDANGRVYSNPWIKGRTSGMLVDFAHGSLMDSLDFMRFDAESRSRDVIASKDDLFSKIEQAFALKDVLAPFSELGMNFKPYHKSFERKGDIDKERKKFRDKIEKMLIDIVVDINKREGMKMKIADGYVQSLCGLAAFYPYVVNGKTRVKVIPCYNTIWDNRVDNAFGESMRFWGFVEYSTPAEIISKYPNLSSAAKVDLSNLATNNVNNFEQFSNYYNSTNNNGLQYWTQQNGQYTIGVTTIFFVAPRDLRFKKVPIGEEEKMYDPAYRFADSDDEKAGKPAMVKPIPKDKKYDEVGGDFLMESIHESVNIGNRWCAKYGYVKNQLRDFYNKGKPTPNMFFFIPKMIMGTPHPPMNFLKKYQDEIDRLGHKIREITSRDYGKIPVINASIMGEAGKQAIDFADDLKNEGVLVARTSAEFMQLTNDLKAVNVIDLSTNQSILSYVSLKAQEKSEMFQTVGKSEIALGQQKSYVSGEVQSTSSSLGDNVMKYQVEGYFEVVRRLLQYMANVQKMLIGNGKDRDGSIVVGVDGVKILKSLGDRKFEDVLLDIKFVDSIDDETKKIILQWGIAWANDPQKSGVLPQDMLAILKEKSIEKMIMILEDSIEKNKMDMAKEQKYKDMITQLKEQVALAHQKDITGIQEEGKDRRQNKDLELKGSQMILDHAKDMKGMQEQEV